MLRGEIWKGIENHHVRMRDVPKAQGACHAVCDKTQTPGGSAEQGLRLPVQGSMEQICMEQEYHRAGMHHIPYEEECERVHRWVQVGGDGNAL